MQLITRAATTLVIGIALASIGLPAASADSPDEVLVSTDGITWVADEAPALFDDLGALVPGGSARAVMQVKNGSSEAAILRIAAVVQSGSSPELIGSLWLTAATPGTVGEPVAMALGSCLPLLDGQSVEPGGIATVDVTAILAASAPNAAQHGSAVVTFVASLVQGAGGALPPVSCQSSAAIPGDTRPAVVASTGADRTGAFAVGLLALLLVMAGGVLFVRDRREP